MKYHKVQLSDDRDATLYLRPDTQKQNVVWEEYLPLAILCILLAGLLLHGLFG